MHLESDETLIEWRPEQITCGAPDECRAEAHAAHARGKSLLSGEPDLAAPYRAYREFARAELLIREAGEMPPADLVTTKAQLEADLDAAFKRMRVRYVQYAKRKMYRQMADQLAQVKARFPDDQSRYHRWAQQKERRMKDDGVYPVR